MNYLGRKFGHVIPMWRWKGRYNCFCNLCKETLWLTEEELKQKKHNCSGITLDRLLAIRKNDKKGEKEFELLLKLLEPRLKRMVWKETKDSKRAEELLPLYKEKVWYCIMYLPEKDLRKANNISHLFMSYLSKALHNLTVSEGKKKETERKIFSSIDIENVKELFSSDDDGITEFEIKDYLEKNHLEDKR